MQIPDHKANFLSSTNGNGNCRYFAFPLTHSPPTREVAEEAPAEMCMVRMFFWKVGW